MKAQYDSRDKVSGLFAPSACHCQALCIEYLDYGCRSYIFDGEKSAHRSASSPQQCPKASESDLQSRHLRSIP